MSTISLNGRTGTEIETQDMEQRRMPLPPFSTNKQAFQKNQMPGAFSGTSRASSRSTSGDGTASPRAQVMQLARAIEKKYEAAKPFASTFVNDDLDYEPGTVVAHESWEIPNRDRGGNDSDHGSGNQGEEPNGACAPYVLQWDQKSIALRRMASEGEALAELLVPVAGDSGIFEVEMPDGEKMGVVADIQADQASFLLHPLSDKLGIRLRQHRMELEAYVGRRIRKNVKITVL